MARVHREGAGAANVRLYRFDGSAWSTVTTLPNARKFGLVALGESDVWAAGWCADVVQWDGAAVHQAGCLDFPVGTFPIATGLWGSSDRNLFVVGAGGETLRYDGGPGSVRSSWLRQSSGEAVDLWDVWGFAGGPVYAVGERGTIVRYDRAAWQRTAPAPARHGLNAVWGIAPNDVWAVGDFGTLGRWNGSAWQAVPKGTREHLRRVRLQRRGGVRRRSARHDPPVGRRGMAGGGQRDDRTLPRRLGGPRRRLGRLV